MLSRRLVKDLVVIGGGSGGIAAAREAAALGLDVTVLDWVSPSQNGTTWGLGGTCVNVGCIPKKLFHRAAQFATDAADASVFGWGGHQTGTHDWGTLVSNVQGHVKAANFAYRSALKREGVQYLNAKARFAGRIEEEGWPIVEARDEDGGTDEIAARAAIVAVGTRPRSLPDVPAAAWETGRVITSDDLFSLAREPGRTLVVGGGYVALECAGFLQALGHPATIVHRSDVFLRGFDSDCASTVVSDLERRGVEVHTRQTIRGIDVREDGVHLEIVPAGGNAVSEVFDTVLLAVGREMSSPEALNLSSVGAALEGGKIKARRGEEANEDGTVFAIGDCLQGALPELTPVAIAQGRRIARKLAAEHGDRQDTRAIDPETHSGPVPRQLRQPWDLRIPASPDPSWVPTAVFTPTEYGSIGLSEEQARSHHGSDVDVIWSRFDTVEAQIVKEVNWQPDAQLESFVKLVIANEGIVGVHVCGPGASEVVQGLAFSQPPIPLEHLARTVGVHPTLSEAMVNSRVHKSMPLSCEQTSC